MRQWLCRIICGNMGATNTVAERANSDRQNSTVDLEAKVRDIRRRIAEQNRRLNRYSTPGDIHQSTKAHTKKESVGTTPEKASRDAELNALKAKLMGKRA